ncbi:MAG TPA: ester cyclase [Candidatus Limnocylindrales bacterium]
MATDTRADLEANKTVARAFIDRVFVHGDPAAIDELAGENFVAHTFGPTPVGRDALKAALPRVADGISDPAFFIDDVIAEDDRVAVRLTSSATHTGTFMSVPPSGNRYTIQEIHIFRIRDGQVVEHWHEFDKAALLAQLKPKVEAAAATR